MGIPNSDEACHRFGDPLPCRCRRNHVSSWGSTIVSASESLPAPRGVSMSIALSGVNVGGDDLMLFGVLVNNSRSSTTRSYVTPQLVLYWLEG
jgi:hypothetical protein